jgi:hypothetical protein
LREIPDKEASREVFICVEGMSLVFMEVDSETAILETSNRHDQAAPEETCLPKGENKSDEKENDSETGAETWGKSSGFHGILGIEFF